jgi:hypothetical protein
VAVFDNNIEIDHGEALLEKHHHEHKRLTKDEGDLSVLL